jgi:type I restriction enzyme S subunit
MSSEQNAVLLGELISHRKGYAFKSKDYVDVGVPVIRVSNFTDDSISRNDLKFVSASIATINSNVILRANDIVVATVGSWPNNPASVVGRTISVPKWAENALMNQNSVIIRSKSTSLMDQRFIYYQMKSKDFSSHVVSKAQGSANQASINLDAIFSFPILWPKSEVRASVVTILNALDDRITRLRETNQTLEAIAQTIFKSWFVDFDPVRAKSKGLEPEGMDAETAAMFPDSFVDSELGEIPEGWRVTSLSTISSFQNGYAFKSGDWSATGYPVVKIGNVKPLLIDFDGCAYVSPQVVMGLDRFKLFAGDLLVGMTGYVGETGLVPHQDTASYLNQRVGRITTKNGLRDIGFVFSAVRQKEFKIYAESQSHGSAQANISGAELMKFRVTVPGANILEKYNDIIYLLIASMLNNHSEARLLTSLRDTLLPRLISGQLRINDADLATEKATA